MGLDAKLRRPGGAELRAPGAGGQNADGGFREGRGRFQGDDPRPWVTHRRRRGLGRRRKRSNSRRGAGVQTRLRVLRARPVPLRPRQDLGGSRPTQSSGARPEPAGLGTSDLFATRGSTPGERSRAMGQPRSSVFREEILAKITELREKVGYSLSLFVVNKYAGGTEPEKLGQAKLTIVFEKLTDIGNGIDRLRRAAAAIGDARYSAICRDLNLASESIDDIPDRDALKLLLARVEAEAAREERRCRGRHTNDEHRGGERQDASGGSENGGQDRQASRRRDHARPRTASSR